MKDDKIALRTLQALAALEATTLIMLVCIAAPLKHLADHDVAVSIMGPVHGIAFILYIWMVIRTASTGFWRAAEVWRLVLAAVVPFGGFMNVMWIARREVQK